MVPMLQTVKRLKIRDVVAKQIKSYIADENLKSGDRLPTENELAEKFGVSRLSLREATKALEFLGIVHSKPGLGLTVGQVNMDRVTEYLGFHPAMHDVSPEELIATRVLIETGVLPRVALRMIHNESIYEDLNGINKELRRARTLQRWVELDLAFHRGLIEASGLTPLLAFGDLLAVFFRRFRESVRTAEWKKGIESHQRLIDALRRGEVVQADANLRRHIESHRDRLRGEQ
jgi:GntR family transcriptional regulator, transcriptional repressor for pyruvate dehydrogenase complex